MRNARLHDQYANKPNALVVIERNQGLLSLLSICKKLYFVNLNFYGLDSKCKFTIQVLRSCINFFYQNHFFLIFIIIVRTRLESLAQTMDGPGPKRPKTMNLQKMGWKTGLKRVRQQIKCAQLIRTGKQIELN